MAGDTVEKLTERALRRGKARSGPWIVARNDANGTIYLQHYGYTVATANVGQRDATVTPRPREGHGISISDGDGIKGFGRGLQLPVEPFKRNPYAYSDRPEPTMVRGHAAPHSSPYHHVGPCDEACRRGTRVHAHKRRRS